MLGTPTTSVARGGGCHISFTHSLSFPSSTHPCSLSSSRSSISLSPCHVSLVPSFSPRIVAQDLFLGFSIKVLCTRVSSEMVKHLARALDTPAYVVNVICCQCCQCMQAKRNLKASCRRFSRLWVFDGSWRSKTATFAHSSN